MIYKCNICETVVEDKDQPCPDCSNKEYTAYPKPHNPCPGCEVNEAIAPHVCPYAACIQNDSKYKCTCCEACTDRHYQEK